MSAENNEFSGLLTLTSASLALGRVCHALGSHEPPKSFASAELPRAVGLSVWLLLYLARRSPKTFRGTMSVIKFLREEFVTLGLEQFIQLGPQMSHNHIGA